MKDIKIISSRGQTTLNEIKGFEKILQSKLPEAYIEFLLKYNGGTAEYTGFPILESLYDDCESGNDDMLGFFYSIGNEEYCSLEQSYRCCTGYEIPEDFIVIADDPGGNYICLCIRGEYYGAVYLKARDNYLYKVAENFTNFINSLYSYCIIHPSEIDRRVCINQHDKYSIGFSTEAKKHGEIVTGFFAKAPSEVEDYIMEQNESTKDLLLWYEVKSIGKKFCRKVYKDGVIEDYEE